MELEALLAYGDVVARLEPRALERGDHPDLAKAALEVVERLLVGEVVTGDVPVRVHYTGVTWDDHEVFESTWGSGAQSVDLSTMIPGFADALRGATVGSQILAVIPPDQAYGDAGQGAIPGGATLVFVIDVLGLDAPA